MKNIKEIPFHSIFKNPSKAATLKSKPGVAMNLRDLLLDRLKNIYWAEKALTKAFPALVKSATSADLADALQGHLEETRNQVNRLEEVFELLDLKVSDKKCVAMEGLIHEAEHMLEETGQGAVRDAGIIAAAQNIEHYQIASYGTLATFARTLGEDYAACILEEILEEEKEADLALSQLAETSINDRANETDEDTLEDERQEDQEESDLEEDQEEDEVEYNDDEEDLDEDMEEEESYLNLYPKVKRK